MPPLNMFQGKARPSGLEFATCKGCNNGTSAADLVASYLARLSQTGDSTGWNVREARDRHHMLQIKAPGFLRELYREEKNRQVLEQSPSGLLTPRMEITADGPLLKAYLAVFAAKLGMALYREHIGEPMPATGGVQTLCFLNAGLSKEVASGTLRILPLRGTLKQGSFVVPEQFAYQYNCDEKSILAALAASTPTCTSSS